MQLLLAQHGMHPNKYRKGTPLLNLNVSQYIFRGYVPGRAFRRVKKGNLHGKRGGVIREKVVFTGRPQGPILPYSGFAG
jgi:hypothetical protein